jgi:UDP-2,4-diacetamido-2,4,6-trideoxy-beta-L-altropyranose hydrolase
MLKRTIVFRADGGPTIGMGHFTRTLALAEMLNEHFHCIFASRQPTEYQISEIEKVCPKRMDLPDNDSHFDKFLESLKGDEIVVLDNYFFTTEYQKAIISKGCKLVCIDDMHDKHFVADIVINHAEGIDPNSYSKESYTKLLLGFQYALIRKEFRQPIGTCKKKYSCLLIMGGADPFNLSEKFIQILKENKLEKPIAVVSALKPKISEACWFHHLNALQISNLMDQSEFAIFPASTVAIEACARRLPFLCGYYIDNQKDIYNGIEKNKLAICMGDLNNLNEAFLIENVNLIKLTTNYNSIIKKQIEFMDMQSPKRLLKHIQEI